MIKVRDYTPTDAEAFYTLNLAWINTFFVLEDEDEAQLKNPQGTIIDIGGRILVADYQGEAVGTVALVPIDKLGTGTLEMVKMSAREDMKGRGIGNALMHAVIALAKDMKAERIWLETNSVLAPAIHLYRKYGFIDLNKDAYAPTPYARCDTQMVLELS